MVDAIILIIALVVGFIAGWKVHEAIIVQAIKTQPEGIEEAIRIAKANRDRGDDEVEITAKDGNTVRTKGVELAIEHVNGQLYAYTKATNQFIAQGETIEDLLKTAHARFPGKVFFGNLPDEEHQKS